MFQGIDHIDTRVWSISVVELFYDRLLPKLGLTRKRHAYVDDDGNWHDATNGRRYNAVEYYEDAVPGRVACFIGFIEDGAMQPVSTRIAFRVGSPAEIEKWLSYLPSIGAINIEPSDSSDYPAIFFEDPCGTKLELVARHPEQ